MVKKLTLALAVDNVCFHSSKNADQMLWNLRFVRAKRARAAGCPQRFARCVAIWCDAQRRVVERCDAPRRVALPTVTSISPTRLIDYAKTWLVARRLQDSVAAVSSLYS